MVLERWAAAMYRFDANSNNGARTASTTSLSSIIAGNVRDGTLLTGSRGDGGGRLTLLGYPLYRSNFLQHFPRLSKYISDVGRMGARLSGAQQPTVGEGGGIRTGML